MSDLKTKPPSLDQALATLRKHERELKARGIRHAAIFGSVARGEARGDSDVDVLVDLDPGKPSGLYEFVRLQLDLSELLGHSVDLIEEPALLKSARPRVAHEAVRAS